MSEKISGKKKRKSWNFRGKEAEIRAEILYMYKTRSQLPDILGAKFVTWAIQGH